MSKEKRKPMVSGMIGMLQKLSMGKMLQQQFIEQLEQQLDKFIMKQKDKLQITPTLQQVIDAFDKRDDFVDAAAQIGITKDDLHGSVTKVYNEMVQEGKI
jgi:hypothetical protein